MNIKNKTDIFREIIVNVKENSCKVINSLYIRMNMQFRANLHMKNINNILLLRATG